MKKFFCISPLGAAIALLLLAGCSAGFHPATEPMANQISGGVGCQNLKSTIWTELYKTAEQGQGFPTREELQNELQEKLVARMGPEKATELVGEIVQQVGNLYSEVVNEASREGKEVPKLLVQELAKMELGDAHTAQKANVQSTVEKSLSQLSEMAKLADLSCGSDGTNPTPPPSVPVVTLSNEGVMLDTWKAQAAPQVYGAWKTMATAYQSCEAVGLSVLGASSTPDVQGITINPNKTSASGGKWREITDLNAFLHSQPYLKAYHQPDPSCFAVEQSPLIYDYGGKPDYSSAVDSDLNLFSDNGSGATNQLGIDCSGYVTTAYLISGLKVSSKNPQRALYAGAIPARNYMSPDGDMMQLDCLHYAEMKDMQGIRPGDTLASTGHVVMIDYVGADPFGLSSFTDKSQCTSANMQPSLYDFSITHSSAILNGIGISRMSAREYFVGTSEMATAIRAYAVAACKAKFGEVSTPMPATAHLVRHSGEAKCLDKSIVLRKSSCLKSCRVSALP